jgi:hypothetical protein
MSWKITVGDESMLLDDLSENEFVAIANAYPDCTWLRLYVSPGAHPGALYDLIAACALKMGVAPPARPTSIKESVQLLNHLEQVDDDLPKAFSEGGIPLPDSEDDPETTMSSTSTGPASGPRNGQEQRP